jgi:hypothetical protein
MECAFNKDTVGGRVVFSGKSSGEPTNVALANRWIVVILGGGPTDDKPTVILETPRDPDGHIIEVGHTTDPEGDWTPAHWPPEQTT